MLRSQGYDVREAEDGIKVTRRPRAKRKPPRAKDGPRQAGAKPVLGKTKPKKSEPVFDPDSPFAKLQELKERMR